MQAADLHKTIKQAQFEYKNTDYYGRTGMSATSRMTIK